MKPISIVFVLLVTLATIYVIPTAYAEEEDDDDDDREGLREMKREREHQDEGIPIDTDVGNVILYGTIAAIGVSIAYTAFKIKSTKRKSSQKSCQIQKDLILMALMLLFLQVFLLPCLEKNFQILN